MKAAIYTKYGPPEVVSIAEVPTPSTSGNELLVRVLATTVNRTDCGFRTPEYGLVVRPMHGLFKPRKRILGTEFAGIVEAIGKDVRSFRIGDSVFGHLGGRFGAHAEYCSMPEDGAVALKPGNLTYEEAAVISDGPWLALTMLKTLDFKKVRNVLVNGASGAIGSACVQLAKHFGTEVTAVCNAKGIEVVRSLGADQIIDYEKDDFTQCGRTYDVVIDAVGKSSFFRSKALLQRNGMYISSELGKFCENPFLALTTRIIRGRQVRFPIPTLNKEDIVFFGKLASHGKLKAIIDRRYSLERIVEAYRYVQTGQKIGNVVITVSS
jgi:NADPH:quinone reductase-like Zn-dependent oxidoreductase